MPKASDILGMNARQQMYGHLNSSAAKSFANSKYATKILLQNNDIPVPKIHTILGTTEDINLFEWQNLDGNFVIKPTNGLAGRGIVVFKKQLPDKEHWIDTMGNTWSIDDLKLHCSDILEGQYSSHGLQHNIIIEERVSIHPKLAKYSYKGTPDIRVIVFNRVPVMAMLRLPTAESEGRANLHQGAIGVGIDIASGITTYAITGKGYPISYLPNTKKKLNGIKIPNWTRLLTVAVMAAEASGLMYGGIDLFVDPDKGPMVVELNAQPGLSIQLATKAGLRRRLERVADLNVMNATHGVKIGQALFAANFSDKIKSKEGLVIIAPKEKVFVLGPNKTEHEVLALANTGRFRGAIAKNLAQELELLDPEDLLWFEKETKEGVAPVVEVKIKVKDRKIRTAMMVSTRLNSSKHKIELGRNDLKGFLVGE